jgi:hypothetical protein
MTDQNPRAFLARIRPPPAGARYYDCPACREPLSFGDSRCDRCGEEAPVYNRPFFWWALWPGLAAIVAIAAWTAMAV